MIDACLQLVCTACQAYPTFVTFQLMPRPFHVCCLVMDSGNDLVLQIKLLPSSSGVAGKIDGSVVTRESRSFENTCYEFPLGFVHKVARISGV